MKLKSVLLFMVLAMFVVSVGPAQIDPQQQEDADPKLPNGRSQKEAILKADHERSLTDSAEMVKLAEDLRLELEKNDRYVVSVGMLKKLDEIEKRTKRIRARLKRY